MSKVIVADLKGLIVLIKCGNGAIIVDRNYADRYIQKDGGKQ